VIRRIPAAEAALDPARALFASRAPSEPRSPSFRALAQAQLSELLSDELTLAPERIARLVERELTRLRGAREVRLELHPDDLVLLPAPAELAARFELAQLTLAPAVELTRGGCIVGSERGEIDARIETRVARMLALLYREAP